MKSAPTPLLAADGIERLRRALDGYTVDSVHDLLGLVGQSALARGDLTGVARAVRRNAPGHDPRLGTLVDLFLLGTEVDDSAARSALLPLDLGIAVHSGLLAVSAGSARARVEIRPYAEAVPVQQPGTPIGDDEPWWVVSDFGADVRGGPLPSDHVLGIGAASVTLAQATPRHPVGRALDIGTGCGVQALHLGRHAGPVTATDISARALRFAATTAALSGQAWDLRAGSLLAPVADERFDLVVANPPFIVSAGDGGYDYRDSGRPGDGVCENLLRGLPSILAPGGTAQLLANWIIPTDGSAPDRIDGWLRGRGCDAWIWQREVAEPGEYVSMWLRDAGEVPGTPRWTTRYDAWLDWFETAGVAAVGMGLVTLWRTGAGAEQIVFDDVPQAIEQPVSGQLSGWIARRRWLAATTDEALLAAALRAAPGLVRTRQDLVDEDGWTTAASRLRQSYGLRWEVEVDDAVAALVAGCDGSVPLRVPAAVLAAGVDRPVAEVAAALAPVVRDLIGRGFLEPTGLEPTGLEPTGLEPTGLG